MGQMKAVGSFLLLPFFLKEEIAGCSDSLAQTYSLLLWLEVSGLKELPMNKLPVLTIPAPTNC